VFAVGALSTMQVKELCRRQLLAKTSAASDKCVTGGNKLPSSGAISTAPSTPSFSAVVSPQASPANIAASPSAAGIQQRSPSFVTDDQLRHPAVESLRPVDAMSTRPMMTWHVPEASCISSVSDVGVNRSPRPSSNSVGVNQSPRPSSNSADSADGAASQQFVS